MSIKSVDNQLSGSKMVVKSTAGKTYGAISGVALFGVGSCQYLDSTHYSKLLDSYKTASKGVHPKYRLLSVAALTVLPMLGLGAIVDSISDTNNKSKFNKIA
ncbi:MAG: hypothetical protein MJ229_07975 [bacterium]|nr:hypothetical protein [bacterium]